MPEVVRGDALPGDPEAAEAIDLYGLGCLAIELARGTPPFQSDDRQGGAPRPRAAPRRARSPSCGRICGEDLRSGRVAARQAAGRPTADGSRRARAARRADRAARRHGPHARVLVVALDAARARWSLGLARRAHAGASVEIAREGTDATHKLHRDRPALVLVDAALRGVMNALELCMYARGIEADDQPELILIGDLAERERALFAGVAVTALPSRRPCRARSSITSAGSPGRAAPPQADHGHRLTARVSGLGRRGGGGGARDGGGRGRRGSSG